MGGGELERSRAGAAAVKMFCLLSDRKPREGFQQQSP